MKVSSDALKRNLIHLSFTISIPIVGVLYKLVNNNNSGAYDIVTSFDRHVPFVKEFIVPYVSWYFYIFFVLLFLFLKDREMYFKALFSYDVGMLFSYVIFLMFQTTVERPELVGNDIFTKMIGWIYYIDKPYNCLPSIHVLTTYVLMRSILESRSKTKLGLYASNITAFLIIISTQFIKQHAILDLIFGVIIGEIIFRIFFSMDLYKIRAWLRRKWNLLTRNKLEA